MRLWLVVYSPGEELSGSPAVKNRPCRCLNLIYVKSSTKSACFLPQSLKVLIIDLEVEKWLRLNSYYYALARQ